MSRRTQQPIPADTSRRSEVRDGWWIVWAPLRDGWQALARPSMGLPLLIVDDSVTEHALEIILRECNAATQGDWDKAPHCRRPAPPRPELHVVRD